MDRRLLSLIVVLGVTIAVALAVDSGEEFYSDKYDYVNVEAILSNERVRNQYYECYLGTKPCLTDDAKFFKERFPDALVTKCRRCTNKQKENFEKLVEYYVKEEPEKWKLVLEKTIEHYQNKSKSRASKKQ